MDTSHSRTFFEISSGPQLENSVEGRLLCVKDFLKKIVFLPLGLFCKAYKTVLRAFGVGFGVSLLLLTVGSSPAARDFFVERMSSFAKDLADWILLPFALTTCLFRLIIGVLFHPTLYFHSI